MKSSLFILILVLLNSWSIAHAGRSSGGGANLCFYNNDWGILDLVHSQGIAESYSSFGLPSSDDRRPGVRIPMPAADSDLSYIPAGDLLTPELKREVIFHLNKLSGATFLRDQMVQMLNNLGFVVTRQSFVRAAKAEFENPTICGPANTKAVFYYSDTMVAMLSAPNWNVLSLVTQAHVLVHETLRAYQDAYNFNDKSLQYLTRQILSSRSADLDFQKLGLSINSKGGRTFALRTSALVFRQNMCLAEEIWGKQLETSLALSQAIQICKGQLAVHGANEQMDMYWYVRKAALEAWEERLKDRSKLKQLIDEINIQLTSLSLSGLQQATIPIGILGRDLLAQRINECARLPKKNCDAARQLLLNSLGGLVP